MVAYLMHALSPPQNDQHTDLKRGFTLSVLKLFWTGARMLSGICC